MTFYIVEMSQRRNKTTILTNLLGILPLSNRLIPPVITHFKLHYVGYKKNNYRILFPDCANCFKFPGCTSPIQNVGKEGLTRISIEAAFHKLNYILFLPLKNE